MNAISTAVTVNKKAPVRLFALLLNEIQTDPRKKAIQTITYFPHFLSWVIIGGIFTDMLMNQGIINQFLGIFGIQPIFFLGSNQWFQPTMIGLEVWKEFGWGAIIYLAAITSINSELYEAATIDGAGKLKQVWHVTLPGISGIIMMMNFFRGINKSLFESAEIDGANDFIILLRVALPLSMASVATLTLFQLVGHWNEWFAATIYINDRSKWPLQTLLSQMLTTIDYSSFNASEISRIKLLSDQSFRGAMIIFATVPILCVYPFMQKYFISGITVGSVKE